MRILGNTDFLFVEKRKVFLIVSFVLIAGSILAFFARGGFNLGIDFSGGMLVQVKFDKLPDIQELRDVLAQGQVPEFQLQTFPNREAVIIQIKGNAENLDKTATTIYNIFSSLNLKFDIERTEFVGPRIGEHLTRRALLAILLSMAGIIIYVAFRFKSAVWGVSAVIALVHDVIIVLGLFCIFNKEITLNVVAAVLTLAGYSVNDTIVIFDRIRENLSLMRKDQLSAVIDRSINQTLSRTAITSLTTEFVLLSLFFLGGEVIHDFSFALLFGVIIGTYSSIFIASPIVYEFITRRTGKK